MVPFIAIVASFLTLGQFFIGCLLKPESIIPSDNRATLLYVVFTASNLFWTLYGLVTDIMLVAVCFGVVLLFNCVILYIRLYVTPKQAKKQAKMPYFPQPRFLKSEKPTAGK